MMSGAIFPSATFLPLVQRSITGGGASGSGGQRIKGLVDDPIRLDSGAVTDLLSMDRPVRSLKKQTNAIIFTPAVPGAHIVHANGGPLWRRPLSMSIQMSRG